MTVERLILLSFVHWILLLVLKWVYFTLDLTVSAGFFNWSFLFFTAVIVSAVCRRFGVITFLEAIFLCIWWFLGDVVLDWLFFSKWINFPVHSNWQLWAGYGVMILAIFFFHKKRHIQIRKELHSQHGGHH